MNGLVTKTTTLGSNKFKTLTLEKHGLIVVNKKKEKTTIMFSELNKIYINKHKFSNLNKIGFMTLVLFSIIISSFYLQLELLVASSFLYIPLIAKMNTYKWYQLNVLLDDGTFFNKIFYTITKQEYINLVNVVRKEIFDNRIQSNK
jgi:ABC-type multidrug transport system permease subunit